jgi:glycosyltransferase involved in cell wall biosynthesis
VIARENTETRAGEDAVDVSVVMPCLNEQQSVPWCVERAWQGIERTGLRGEVVVCDNGSVDRSVEVAEQAGARVVHEARRGYGRAYLTGIDASGGRIIVIGDSDCSYDFFELHRLISPLADGYDYVLGSRLGGTILPGAMPFLNRYVGNPVLTGLLNALFGLDTSDAHSGMRAFTRSGYEGMSLRCEGMEFASEIVIAAARTGLRTTEVPITYHPRLGPSKLRRWRDGLRHLQFMFSEAVFPDPRWTSAVTSSGSSPEVAVVNGNGVGFSEPELTPPAPSGTSRLARPAVDAGASGGDGRSVAETPRAGGIRTQPPAARPEVP